MKEASKLIALLTILLLVLGNQQASAQNLKAYERAATEAFEKKSYYNAMYYYGIVLKSKKNSATVLQLCTSLSFVQRLLRGRRSLQKSN